MATLTLRNVKGTALTFQEGDSNFLALDSDSPWSVAASYIHYDGRVGIGPNSSNPTYSLDFAEGVANEATIGTSDADINVHVNGPRKFKVTTNGTERVTMSTAGKFGIGQTDPQFELDVGGYANVSNTLYANALEANSFTDGTLSVSGGSILNAKRIVSTTQFDFTQLYDRSTGYRVDHIDSLMTSSRTAFPTSFAVTAVTIDLETKLDSESAYLRARLDSEHAWIIDNNIDLQNNIDSNHTSLLAKENQLQLNIDSVNSSLISHADSLQYQLDSLNDKIGVVGLQEITDITATTTNKIQITNAGGIEAPRISGNHQGFTGLQFQTAAIIALDNGGLTSNGVVDLGSSSKTFKDAYFSGTLNVPEIEGNATTATTLQTARPINGTEFDGSTGIVTEYWGTTRTITIGDTAKLVNGSSDETWTRAEVGITKTNIDALNIHSANADTLTTARNINGTAFNGSADITTVQWGTARNITIGDTAKSVNGSANYAWTTAEIGITKTNIEALGISASQTVNSVTFNNGGSGDASGTTFNGSTAKTVSYNTIGAPSTSGTNASGTWGINISGNAVTANTADKVANAFTVQGTAFDGSAVKSVTFGGGTGITVSGTTITNTAPDQTVSIASAGATTVTGTYPNFTVSSTDTTYSAGTGLSLSGTTFTNTAPDRTVAISGSGATTVTGTYPTFSVSSTNTTYTAGTGLSLSGTTFTNTAPDRTVALTGAGGLTVTGTYPNFTLTQGAGAALVAGTGISVSGSTITNTLPDRTVSLTGAGGLTVTGSYPNFTLTQGAGSALTGGTGISVSGSTITNTLPDRTVAISGSGATSVTGTYPNFTVSSTNTTYTAGNGLTLSGTQFLMSGSYTGTFTASGDVVAFSDVSLKSDINPITAALEKVGQIGGYTYLKEGDDHKRTGVLAQEIQQVLPEAVHTNEEGVLGVAYGNLTGLLIEAVKELNAKVKDLESKLGV